MTRVSVVIPTFNRAAMLRDLLETLCVQDVPFDAFEVVVVDDGSTDATASVVEDFGGRLPLRSVHQENAGLNAARNTGAEASTGEILAFLDDDVLLPPDFVREVGAAWTRFPSAAAVAGRVLLRFESPPPAWLHERFHSYLSAFDRGPEPGPLPEPCFPVGANAIVTRAAWKRVGGFASDLDRRGASLISSGDKEFFLRLRQAGAEIVWWPDAWVFHRVHPERLSRRWFRRRAYAQGLGDGLMERASGRSGRLRREGRELVRLGRAAPILARNLATGRGTLSADLWLRFCLGRLRGLTHPHASPARRLS